MSDLELYENMECSKPFSVCDFIEVEIGRSKSKECYMKNNSLFTISQIKETMKDEDLSIANLPNQLASNEVKSLIVTFKPSMNRRVKLSDNILTTGKLVVN